MTHDPKPAAGETKELFISKPNLVKIAAGVAYGLQTEHSRPLIDLKLYERAIRAAFEKAGYVYER